MKNNHHGLAQLLAQHGQTRGERPPPLLLLPDAGPQPLSPRWRDAILVVAAFVLGATVAFWLSVAGAP